MSRSIVIGDVHGCLQELDELLARLSPSDGDRLCFIGDLVDRGPDSLGVVRRVRELFARHPDSMCLCGNHEEKALRFHERGRNAELEEWARLASEDDFAFLAGLPLLARLDAFGVLLIHGGIFPRFFEQHGRIGEVPAQWRRGGGKRMDRMRRFLRVRSVDGDGNMVTLGNEAADSVHWAQAYDGREGFCFFGHDPQLDPPEPLRARHALGIDTGCCFGGRLTAAILRPASAPADAEIVQVAAKQRYAEPRLALVDA